MVPLSKSRGQGTSQASSPVGTLNPSAATFEPNQSSFGESLRAIATTFVPPLTGKAEYSFEMQSPFRDITDMIAGMTVEEDALRFDEIESPTTTADVADPAHQIVDEGTYFASDANALVLNCNTHDIPNPTHSREIISNLIGAGNLPQTVQLNVYTGPRFQRVHKAVQWFTRSISQYMRIVRKVQINILRCGEYLSGEWVIPTINLLQFQPLLNFVAELLQGLPKDAYIIWGASDQLSLLLREHYLARAVPAEQAAFEQDIDKGVKRYSEIVSRATLQTIASQFKQLQGKKAYSTLDSLPTPVARGNTPSLTYDRSSAASRASSLNPKAAPFTSRLFNPKAKPFVPQLTYNRPSPLFVPKQLCTAQELVDSNGPFYERMSEVKTGRNGWVPPVYDFGPQYDTHFMYENTMNIALMASTANYNRMAMDRNGNYIYGGPTQMPTYSTQAPCLVDPTPPPTYRSYDGAASVYATVPHHARRFYNKKGKKKSVKDDDYTRPYQYRAPNQYPNTNQTFHGILELNQVKHQRSYQNGHCSYDNHAINGYGISYDGGTGNTHGAYNSTYSCAGSTRHGQDDRNTNRNSTSNGTTNANTNTDTASRSTGKKNKNKRKKNRQEPNQAPLKVYSNSGYNTLMNGHRNFAVAKVNGEEYMGGVSVGAQGVPFSPFRWAENDEANKQNCPFDSPMTQW